MSLVEYAIVVIFWGCLLLAAYVYAGYPLLIWVLSRLFGKRGRPPVAKAQELPLVSLLVCAYNEEVAIEQRVINALALDYPRDLLEIVIASDGSSDQTAEIVRRYTERGVRLLDYSRRGKAAVLNSAFPELTGELVMLSDANTFTDPQAVRKLVRWFVDPQVGVVCGRLELRDQKRSRNVDALYWNYETFLKRCEGRLGALLGANGGNYAIRRELFSHVPSSSMDDLLIPLLARQRTGCAIVFDSEAIACEETPQQLRVEFKRRVRYGASSLQSLGLLWRLLNPREGWVALTFLSHKVLRWFCPFFLVALLVANLLLVDRPLYRALLLGHLGFYLMALVGACLPPGIKLSKPVRLATMFTGMNIALLLGFWRWIRGARQQGMWESTPRHADAGQVGA